MRFARLLLAGLLSLGVAIQGYASTRAMEAGCPMEHPVAQPASPATPHAMHDMGAADQAPCHGDDSAPAGNDTGHCGCVVGCQPAGTLPMVTAVLPAAVPLAGESALPVVAASFHSHTAFRHWRPPASI